MKTHLVHLITFVVVLLPLSVNTMYLNMAHTETKCFFEEIPYETMILAKYKLEVERENATNAPKRAIFQFRRQSSRSHNNDTTGLGLQVDVKDPDGGIILSKIFGKEGRIAVTSHMAGVHSICLSSNDTSLEGRLRIHLDIRIGGRAVDYDLVGRKEKYTALQLTLRKLQDLTEQISKEQDFLRTRENRFRQTSESTYGRVLFFAVLQTIILISVSLYQVRHLKTFFIIKKLV